MAHGKVWQTEAERGGAERQGCGGVEVSHPASRASTPLLLLLREALVPTRADVPPGMITGTFQEPYGIYFRVPTPSAQETASSPSKLS